MSNLVKKYKNRYGDEYWFENIGPNQYRFVMTGTSMKWCRYGGHDLQEHLDMNDLGMFDPSGGPYIAIGTQLPVGKVKRIQSLEESIILTVEPLSNYMKEIKEKCDRILHAVVGPNAIDGWWNSPNKAFDMKPAKEVFEEDPNRVYRYLLNQVQR